ncbi:hypothetical protein N7541_002314 [Penicillium brevicompactum]|uniref:Nuclear pore complex protein n=1 Tax=Penicillium brevicompactum TaxID=5074 RepID=A0A9W9RKZ0_PENBR|nr:hypothetical protein N7541_002314 [Penicillium brevicompactum]
MAPLTRSAAGTSLFTPAAQPPRHTEIINVDDEDDEQQSLEDEETNGDGQSYASQSEDQDETMDEGMDGVNGEPASETGSEVSVQGSVEQSNFSLSNKGQDTPLFTAAGAQEALHPLRRTADRVTRQIEAFADKLDQFKRQNSTDEFNSAQAAYKLVESYRDLANNAIKEIQKQQVLDRAKSGFRSSGTQEEKSTEEIRRLQLESDTWRLLLNLISIDDPSSRARYKAGQQTAFQELHRYSTDREIWEQFLNADQYGLECVIAMRWLEETSKTGDQDIDLLIATMENQSQRGDGLWSHGWLYTKEAIKGHKRLRAWPQPLEPNDPGISRSLLSKDEQKPLITQLDPDAVTRQNHTLETQDQSFELATWATCWKMLRQGENWTKIREWAENHLEGWRAVSLCGSSVDPKSASTQYPADDGHTRLMNSRAQDSWRSACSSLTRNKNVNDFQRAVYALLAGETEAAANVCRGWDDYLYVFFNRVVLSRYQGFCRQFQRKLSHSPTTPVTFKPEPAGHAELQKYLVFLKGNKRVSGETRNPFRNMQAAILSQGYDSFFPALAHAVSDVSAAKSGNTSIVPVLPHKAVDESYFIAADDPEALKIAAHVYVVASARGYARADSHFIETASVIVAGHIANLEDRGLFHLIPLYASLLPTSMCHSVLAKILIDILDPEEKRQQVQLANKYNIDINTVLDVQWAWVKEKVSAVDHSRGITGYSRMSRRSDGSKHLVSPKPDLIGVSVSEEDDKMIRSLEWLRVTDGQWDKICDLGTWLYRKFMVADKLAAARELSFRMRTADISIEKFGSDIISMPPQDLGYSEATTPTSPTKSKRNSLHLHRRSTSGSNNIGLLSAYNQCQAMRDLESLILGLDAVEAFAIIHEQRSKTKRRRDSGTLKVMGQELEECVGVLEDWIAAVTDEEWLLKSPDPEEEKDFAHIRTTYIPELVLDYHNAMYFASYCLERNDLLTQCMVTSIWVANYQHITLAFTQAQRMAELMEVLALSSKALVIRNTSSPKSSKDELIQEVKIWDVEVTEDEKKRIGLTSAYDPAI